MRAQVCLFISKDVCDNMIEIMGSISLKIVYSKIKKENLQMSYKKHELVAFSKIEWIYWNIYLIYV